MLNQGFMRATLGIWLLFGSFQANAGSLRCEPDVLRYAVQAFESAKVNGVVAVGLDGQQVSLGTNVEVESVEVQNLFKEAFRIRFQLSFIDNISTRKILQTTLYAVDSETCSIYEDLERQLGQPSYRIIDERRY